MLLHLPHVVEVPNSWGTFPLSELISEIHRGSASDPDAVMRHFDFPILQGMGVVNPQYDTDYAKILAEVETGFQINFPRESFDLPEAGLSYIGDVVELKIPTLFAHLLRERHERGQVGDMLGCIVNLYLARFPKSQASPYNLLHLFAAYYGEEALREVCAAYGAFLRELRGLLAAADLSVHIATNNLHRIQGTCLYIPGNVEQVAQAVSCYLQDFAHLIKPHKALIVHHDPGNLSSDVLTYDEFGKPDEYNFRKNVTFAQDVASFYRKRKLQALVSE